MTELQKYQLEWVHVSRNKWELQNKADGFKEIASLTLSGEQWKPRIESPASGHSTFISMPFLEAKAQAEVDALLIWKHCLTPLEMAEGVEPVAEEEKLVEVEFV